MEPEQPNDGKGFGQYRQKRRSPLLQEGFLSGQSGGTEVKPRINQDAVRLMKQLHGIDMEATQHSKLLCDIPQVDVVITMGCNVQCPNIPCSLREDWGLEDPTGKDDDAFIETIRLIEEKMINLRARLTSDEKTL